MNRFGHLFTVSSFGESHGPAMGCIVDGCPPGLELSAERIQPFLDRRRPGQSQFTTQRREPDSVEILSGVFEGKTTGTAIALMIKNQDQRGRDYDELKDKFRPGHADYSYYKKYGIRDYRGGGRASARETVNWVAAGAIARIYLKEQLNIDFQAWLDKLGSLSLEFSSFEAIDKNPFFCPNLHQLEQCEALIRALRSEGDSIGAQVRLMIQGLPAGLGSPVFGKLDALMAFAMMSIPAAKGVDIGEGFAVVEKNGSQHRDEMNENGFLSNHAGGILGGISTGQPVELSVAFKPTSSIVKEARTVNMEGKPCLVSVKGRHDPCVGIRAVPVVEAMAALVIMDQYLIHKAQNL